MVSPEKAGSSSVGKLVPSNLRIPRKVFKDAGNLPHFAACAEDRTLGGFESRPAIHPDSARGPGRRQNRLDTIRISRFNCRLNQSIRQDRASCRVVGREKRTIQSDVFRAETACEDLHQRRPDRKGLEDTLGSFARVFPFIWPHRRKVYLSFVFAVVVAFLWGANLSVAFPIVKVLLQGEDLGEYIDREILEAEKEIARRAATVEELDRRIEASKQAAAEAGQESATGNFDDLKDRAREQRKLTSASRQLVIANWVKTYVMPWVPSDQFDTFAVILGVLLVATLIKGVAIFMQDLLIGSVVELSVLGIRKECFRRTLTLDYQTLAMDGTANLMSRFTYDVNVMSDGLSLLGGKVIREPLKAAACIVFAFYVNWRLTLLSLLFVPFIGLVFHRYGRMLKQASHRMMESMSRIYKSLEETFDALKVVIAFDGARKHRQRFHRENKEYYSKAMKVVQIDALTSPTTELMGLFAVSLALLPGAYLVLRGTTEIWNIQLAAERMDIADLSVLYAFLVGTLDPIRKLSSVYSKLKRSAAATERIFSLIDRETLVTPPEQPKMLPRHSRQITFERVYFSYAGLRGELQERRAALDNVSLRIKAGEVVAVVGENGSGKSTLVNLLPRFYDPDRGKVLIDETDIRDVRLRELRSQIGVVTQETLLFDDTIYENIRYGRRNATREEIEAAARQAHVTPFLEQLPDGFETVVGEKGQRLSGGQRQRIALARAILRDPAILILDEATSAIDAQSEYLIHQVLRGFVKGRTTFIITHSVSQSILDFVTRIVVMEDGKLIANGPHKMLIETCPAYQRLFHSQSRQRSALTPEAAASDVTAAAVPTPAPPLKAAPEAHEDPDVIPFPAGSEAPRPKPSTDGNTPQSGNHSDKRRMC